MAEVEMLYSARQLADELGITLQMLSKYAQAYSKLTKQQIMKQGRNGRHFTPDQREVIKNARDMVRSQTGLTVEDALKRALVFDPAPLEVESGTVEAAVDLAALEVAFRAALRDEVTTPLIAEIQGLKAEIADLKQGRDLKLSREKENTSVEVENHGPVVRLALWIEQRFRGR